LLFFPPMSSIPILYSAHHCSSDFGKFSNRSALSAEQRKRLSDCGTDLTVPLHGKVLLAGYSRGIVDLNRPLDRIDLFRDTDFADPPNRIWIPSQEPTPNEREDIIQRIYRSYHDCILRCLQELSHEHRSIVVVAWDNMGRYPLRGDGSLRPGLIVPVVLSNCGTNGSTDKDGQQQEPTSCSPVILYALAAEFRTALLACGFSSDIADGIHFNLPKFKGGYICEHYNTRRHPELHVDADVQSLQVEYDIALTHNPGTLKTDNDATHRLRQAFAMAMERAYVNLLQQVS